jgi:hypothetical protein
MIRMLLTLGACAALANQPGAQSPSERPPIIDVHLHAYEASEWKGHSRTQSRGSLDRRQQTSTCARRWGRWSGTTS